MTEAKDTNYILLKISNEMRAHDLQNLKHLCHERIPLGELEKANNPHDLFRIMFQKLLIRPGNLSFLEEMLKKIGRADLATKIQTSGGDNTLQTESALPSNPSEGNYRGFLMKLSDELTKDNVESLKFVSNLPDAIDEKVQNGKDLFKYLVQRGSIGQNNMNHLVNMLQEIHRKDLAEKVRKFQGDGASCPTNLNTASIPLINNPTPRNTQQSGPVITAKQPTMHQMVGLRSPTAVLMSPAAFSATRPPARETTEPRFPVQAMANPAELVEPLQGLGVDEEEAMPSYPMTRRPRGIALIISNEHFVENPSLRDRQGNQKDVEQLQELWQFLNFEVILKHDLVSEEIYDVLRDISRMDHSLFDCFVCCLLSHGADGGIFGTDCELVEIKDITALFKGVACPSLANKPKLFFIQACRGQNFDRGAQLQMDAAEVDPDDAIRHNAEPNESHFLLGYATPPGYVSWRSQIHGSWYISKLCEVFRKFCERFDVMTMMVKVNDEVSEAFTKRGYKQCPAPVVTLRRRIYFNKN